ncbi:PAS domain S-box protein [Aridibaculum aurantiacum]|uniref:PAS domain-containing sensor histidine kinase n=1 Tax=Aridibaculum aurantiacum TaxID=2810307 RepID=UPI001A968F49|nr:PAS domain S-box protein [Aridibaculum aurantiacum]
MTKSHFNNSQDWDNTTRQISFDNAPISMLLLDAVSLKIEAANKAALQLLGYTMEEIRGLEFTTIDLSASQTMFENLFDIDNNGKREVSHTTFTKKDGTPIHSEVFYTTINVEGTRLVLVTITDQVVPSKAAESYREHSALYNVISDAIVATDENFKITSYNQPASEIFGWKEEEVIGKPVREITASIYPHNTPDEVAAMLLHQGHWQGEIITHRKDGNKFPAYISVNTLQDIEGKVTGTVCVIRDLSKQKELHNQVNYLSALLNKVSDAIIYVDDAYKILNWNHGAELLFGIKKEEAISKNLLNIFGHSNTTELKNDIVNLQTKDENWQFEMQFFDEQTNTQKWIIFSASKIEDQAGEETGYIVIGKDITERKNLGEQLLQLNKQLEEKVNKKGEELAHVYERISDAFIAFDSNLKYTYLNHQAETISGKTTGELINKNAFEEENPLITPELHEHMAAAIASHKPVYKDVYLQGIDKWYQTAMYPSREGLAIYFQDITERKLAEKQLQHSEQRFKKLVTGGNDLISIIDREGNFIYNSPTSIKVLNYDPEFFDGKHISDLLHPDDLEIAFATVNKVLEEKTIISPHVRLKHGDGSWRWIEATLKNLLDDPDVQGIVINARDITEILKAEHEKELERKDKEALINTSTDLMWSIDKNYHLIAGNHSFKQSLKASSNLELNPGETVLSYEYFDEEHLSMWKAFYDRALSGEEFESEIIVTSKEGTGNMWMLIRFHPVYNDGEIIAAACYATDVTERKLAADKLRESERKFKAIFQNSVNGIALMSIEGNIIEISSSAEEILGIPRDELINSNKHDFIVPEYVPLMLNTFNEVASNTGLEKTVSLEILHPSGTTKWLECTYRNYLNDPAVNAIVTNFRDITQVKKYAEEIENSEARYKKAQMIGKMGHWELNLLTEEVYWSEEIYNLFGVEEESFKPTFELFMHFVHPDDRSMVDNMLQLATAGLIDYNVIHRITLPTGEIRYMHELGEAVRNSEGVPEKFVGTVQDVTEQKVTEEKLRASEKNYKVLFDKNPVPLYMIQPLDFNIIEANRATESQYGYTKEELLNMSVQDLRAEKDETLLAYLNDLFVKNKNVDTVVKQKKKNGEIIYTKVNTDKIFYKNIEAWLVAARDITKEIQYQKQLKDNQQQLSIIFNSTINGMVLFKVESGNQFRFEAINDALAEAIRVDKDEVVGQILQQVFEPATIEHLLPLYKSAVTTGEVQNLITGSRRRLTKRIIHYTAIPIKNEQGEVEQLLSISNDITEQKLTEEKLKSSEEKYRLLFQRGAHPKWIFDAETLQFLEVNDAAVRHYGYSRQEFLQMTLFDIRPDEEKEKLQGLVAQSIPSETSVLSTHKTKTGKLIRAHVTINTINLNNKDARLATIVDLTEQELAKQELLDTTRQLRQLASHIEQVREEERTHIAREIHDELGQQLTGLKMDLSWIGKRLQASDEELQQKMKSSLLLLDETIHTVRKISTELRPGILEDLGLADAIRWQGEEFTRRTGIIVQLHTNVEEEQFAQPISIALFRIHQEALTNALKHADATLIESSLHKENNLIRLSITDNGSGFDKEEAKEKRTFGLLGITERVNILNGSFHIDTFPGKGTTIAVEIPL